MPCTARPSHNARTETFPELVKACPLTATSETRAVQLKACAGAEAVEGDVKLQVTATTGLRS